MRILIFGCGFLGHRVARRWVSAGQEVFAVTRSPDKAVQLAQEGITPIVADICDPDSLSNLPDVDVVLHAVGFDRTSGQSHEEVTVSALVHILSAIKSQRPHWIHISSTSVYGQTTGEWVTEDSACEPTQPGGQLCLRAESLLRECYDSKRLAGLHVLRLAGIYGPSRLLSRIESLKAGLPLTGRGDSWLNLIHVEDAVEAVLASVPRLSRVGTWNVVDDLPIQRQTYFETLARLVKAPVPTFDTTQPGSRGSGGLNKRCSNEKIREELGWSPAFPSIEKGLPDAINLTVGAHD